jgi:hypothetical protein
VAFKVHLRPSVPSYGDCRYAWWLDLYTLRPDPFGVLRDRLPLHPLEEDDERPLEGFSLHNSARLSRESALAIEMRMGAAPYHPVIGVFGCRVRFVPDGQSPDAPGGVTFDLHYPARFVHSRIVESLELGLRKVVDLVARSWTSR